MDVPRYRFGPLEHRGFIAGLGVSQVVILAVGAIVALIVLRAASSGTAVAVAVAILAIAAVGSFAHVSGRPVVEWVGLCLAWWWRGIAGRRRFHSSLPSAATFAPDPQPHFPGPLAGATILAHPVASSGGHIGVLKHARAGTYTAVVKVRGRSFSLLDPQEKARRLSSWGACLAGFARERTIVHRLQWVERTLPDPSDEIALHLRDKAVLALDSPIVRSYLEVIDDAGPVSLEHEVVVALQVHAGHAARAIKAAGGGDHGACEVLQRELASLTSSLMSAEVVVEGALTPRLLAAALRVGFDPGSRRHLARLSSRNPDRAGSALAAAGPMATEASWSAYHCDGAFHATYWIAEWPRVDVDADFLAPLLLRTECTRAVSLTMEPIPALRAIRAVESARTSMAADEDLRDRAGFLSTARRRREDDALAQHERELGNGHAFYRFAGHVTVSAPSLEELEAACGEIEEAAGRCLLDVRRLDGQHDLAFVRTLPTAMGL